MRFIISIIIVLLFLSCGVDNGPNEDDFVTTIRILDIDRSLISGLSSPKVDYTLEKDAADYLDVTDYVLEEIDGYYVLSLNLLSGADYRFTLFTITTDAGVEFILDSDSTGNTDGFNISTNGVLSVTPTIYLKKVSGVEYEQIDYENIDITVVLDEASQLEPAELTFRVSSNIVDATFEIFKYSIYWKSGGILQQNEIFDMDTGVVFDPLEEGDNESWGTGKFKIVTTDSQGESVSVVGISEDWSRKHIFLNL